MSPVEAKEFGLIDEVMLSRPVREGEQDASMGRK
jgi:ATP-dependent protease ClpP protease subunit